MKESKKRGRRRSLRFRAKGESRLKATVDKNRKGFAFLVLETKGQKDLFLGKRQAEALFHGDRVEVILDHAGRIKDLRVLQHRYREIVGIFQGGKPARVVYERKNTREEIQISNQPSSDVGKPSKHPHLKHVPDRRQKTALMPKNGDWVRVKLNFGSPTASNPTGVTGQIEEVFGKTLPASADISMIAAEFGCVEEHTHDAVREASNKKLEQPFKDRVDLRKKEFITIDGETARDFDDAILVEEHSSGFTLWVAIADVSHYVVEGSALDQEAKMRGTSVYFPERAFHMLPGALSENLCSLKPNEPRLALVAKMEFNREGVKKRTELMEAVIESKRRATYEQIHAERDAHMREQGLDPSWLLTPHFNLYELLKKVRRDRGSIDFDLPEAEVRADAQGEVISIENRTRLDTHRLIEEFMIAANEAATEWMMQRSWPFVYRIHDTPSPEALDRFAALAATSGLKLDLRTGAAVAPNVLAAVVRKLEGNPSQALLNMALLRSMKQAVYSSRHGIHYGLASQGYTHFTSPIRRYPDLVVHRLIRMALRAGGKKCNLSGNARKKLEKELAEVCEHCSYRERLAADAEREVIKLKQVRLMSKHLGEEYDGKIVGMIAAGFFVQIASPFVEGMVSGDSLPDGSYDFNEERMVFHLTSRGKKHMIRIGDQVRVQVVRTDLERRQIDFILK